MSNKNIFGITPGQIGNIRGDLSIGGTVEIGTSPNSYTLPLVKGNDGDIITSTDGVCSWTTPPEEFNQSLNTSDDVSFQNLTVSGEINTTNDLVIKHAGVPKFGAYVSETAVVGAGVGNLYGISNGVHSLKVGAVDILEVNATGCTVDGHIVFKQNGSLETKIMSDGDGAISMLDSTGNYVLYLSSNNISTYNYANASTGNRISNTRGRGTQLNPAGLLRFDRISEINDYGIDSVAGTGGFGCSVLSRATEDWVPGNHGMEYRIATTDNGSVNPTQKILLDSNGVTMNAGTETFTFPLARPTLQQVLYAADSNGVLAWGSISNILPTKAYGDMYFKDNNTETTMSVQGTYYRVGGGTALSGLLSLFTLGSNLLTYTGTTRTFKVSVNVSWSSNQRETYSIAIWKNGATVASSPIRAVLDDNNSYPRNCSTECLLTLTTNDTISPAVTCLTNTHDLIVHDLSFNIVEIRWE